jgi:phage terminase small subunit
MPALKNARREKFAQLIERGWTLEKAHAMAGFAVDRGNAWRLQHQNDIAHRIEELAEQRLAREATAQLRAQQKLDISSERTLAEMSKIAFANMLDYLTLDEDGNPKLDLASITRDQGAAISEVILDEYMDGRGKNAKRVKRVRVKLSNKIEALNAIARHLGLFADTSLLNLSVNNYFSEKPLSMSEWEAEIAGQLPGPDRN